MINDKRIDGGKGFDWGRTSKDYAKYRDVYPNEFYEKIHSLGLCTENQSVLDVGTGTGVLPRNMYKYGAKFTGTDISEKQVLYARELADESGMSINFYCASAENTNFPSESFDVITACQCYFYFNHEIFAPNAYKMLRSGGKLAFLYMAWLPFDDKIAGKSEELVLKFNPEWNGCGEIRHEIAIPHDYSNYFNVIHSTIFDVEIPFTKESWNGRIKTCRGIGASLSEDKIAQFEKEHIALLNYITNDDLKILHYCAITILEKK